MPTISPFLTSKLTGLLSGQTTKFSALITTLSVLVCIAIDVDFSPVSSLPVIKPIKFFSLRSFFSNTPTSLPSLITVALSLILTSSAIR